MPLEAVVAHPRSLAARRAGAVFSGLFTVFALSTAADVILHSTGVYPPIGGPPMSDDIFLLAFTYRAAFSVAGSWLTARLAPSHPTGHALALGTVGLALSIAGAIAMWDAGPAWYSVGVAASALPLAYLGALIHSRVGR